jgi:hypothetical protein
MLVFAEPIFFDIDAPLSLSCPTIFARRSELT